MNNCLIDTAIQDIIWNCRCRPKFVLYKEITQYLKLIPFCTGTKLFCANARSKSFGMEKIAKENDIILQEAISMFYPSSAMFSSFKSILLSRLFQNSRLMTG